MLMPLRQPAWTRWLPEQLCPWLAFLLIFAVALGHLIYLATDCPLDLAPDEAHYWDWSRHLDWSYYSKGPLVAWLIRGSCELLGSWSERVTGSLTFAVRVPAIICGSLLLGSLYVLTVQVFAQPRLGLAVVVVALTMPVITAGSFLMTIDAPYTCCWGWALVFAHRAITGRSFWAWEATGVMIGLGILAKYTMVLFPFSLGLYLLASRARRSLLGSKGFWSMVGIALLCCAPILIWNAQHDWVTVRHVLRLAGMTVGGERPLRGGSGWQVLGPIYYVGGQAALLLGYWFVVWLTAMVVHNPLRDRDPDVRYLWWLSAPVFLVFGAFSFKTGGGELNWPVTAYLSGGVLSAAWLAKQFDGRASWGYRTAGAIAIGITMGIGLSLTVVLHRSQWIHPVLEKWAGPATPSNPFPVRKLDPTCRLRGWRYLSSQIDVLRNRLRAQGIDPVLAGISWSVPGEIGVYCAGHPQAYSLGLLQGDRHSQYDLWTNPLYHPEEFLGKTFLIVGPLKPNLEAGFSRMEPMVPVVYQENGRTLAIWTLHVGHGFKGFPQVPEAPH